MRLLLSFEAKIAIVFRNCSCDCFGFFGGVRSDADRKDRGFVFLRDGGLVAEPTQRILSGEITAFGEVEFFDGNLEDGGRAHESTLGRKVGFLAPFLSLTGDFLGKAVHFDHHTTGSVGSERSFFSPRQSGGQQARGQKRTEADRE